MTLGENLRALRAHLRRDGLRRTLSRGIEVLGERLIQPWEIIFWISAAEVARSELPPGARFLVVRAFAELEREDQREIESRFVESTRQIWEERLRQGCELHLLFLGDRLAASRFVIWGSVSPFQNVVLTPRDAMALDVRVDPEVRGRGLGVLFCSLSIQDLAERGCDRVFATASVHNTRSVKTIERVGYQALLRCRIERGHYRYDRDLIR